MAYTVMIESAGGVVHELVSFNTEKEAGHFCVDNGWEWMDENCFVWQMYYEPDADALINLPSDVSVECVAMFDEAGLNDADYDCYNDYFEEAIAEYLTKSYGVRVKGFKYNSNATNVFISDIEWEVE